MSPQTDRQCAETRDAVAVRRALGHAAHDLNNTVGALANFADFLAEDLDAADPRRADAERIRTLAQESIAYLRDMLAVAGRDFLQPAHVELAPFLERFVEESAACTGAQITLHADDSMCAVAVLVDPGRLHETLAALVANAVEASDPSCRLTIELAGEQDRDACVAISVTDQGRGFDAEVLADPFAPLTRSPEGHKRWSLAKAAGFMTQSGGDISIQSQEGIGATVSLRLPLAPDTGPATGLVRS